jgi:SWI/SNF-related matrix-associated actin-dependent regulator 1 of chromatin subfamily A
MQFPNGFEPLKWQTVALHKFKSSGLNNFILLAEVGTGKTFTAISMLRMLQEKHGPMKILVLCPGVVINNWKNELKKFSFPQDFPLIHPLDVAKYRTDKMQSINFRREQAVVITNYESMDQKLFYRYLKDWMPDIIIADEIHRIKNPKSKRAQAVVQLGEKALYRLGLTGTAILNSPMDIFQQYLFLDQGEAFGKSFFNFRRTYFYDANESWNNKQNHFPDFRPITGKMDEMSDKISRNSVKVIKAECLDLPPFIRQTLKLKMNDEQKKAYNSMFKDFLAFVETEGQAKASVANIALTKGLRLIQIASGFMGLDDGSTFSFKENPKLEALDGILEETGDDKVIIWCSYRQNYGDISRFLMDRKIKFVMITGEQDSKEKTEAADKFQTDPTVKVMVANRKAAGIGINLTAAPYSVVFSRNFSLEEEIQAQGRNYRNGSQIHDKVTEINLIMEDTIEERVVEALQNKQSISDIILDFK